MPTKRTKHIDTPAACITGTIVVVQITGLALVHELPHVNLDGLRAQEWADLPHGHNEGQPIELQRALTAAVSSATATTSFGSISWSTPGWPPCAT
jgi:hypothetical protein